MSSPTFVEIPKQVHDSIAQWAERAYPFEGCGLLIGRFEQGGKKSVVRLESLENKLLKKDFSDQVTTLPAERLNRPEVGFAFDPNEFNAATLKAEKEGLDIVGVIHTHPDHPPRPSRIDESQPFLAFWSNIIVSVQKGKTAEMKAWYRESDDLPFNEELLKIS